MILNSMDTFVFTYIAYILNNSRQVIRIWLLHSVNTFVSHVIQIRLFIAVSSIFSIKLHYFS